MKTKRSNPQNKQTKRKQQNSKNTLRKKRQTIKTGRRQTASQPQKHGITSTPYPESLDLPTLEWEAEQALKGKKGEQVMVRGFNMSMTRYDLRNLLPYGSCGEKIVDFYLRMIQKKYQSVFVFPSDFFVKLQRKGYRDASEKYGNIISTSKRKEMLIIPISQSLDWCLCVVDTRRKEIFFFDPKGFTWRGSVFLPCIEAYLGKEYPVDTWEVTNVNVLPYTDGNHSIGDSVPFICKAAYCFAAGKYPPPLYLDRLNYYRCNMIHEILAKTLSPLSLSI